MKFDAAIELLEKKLKATMKDVSHGKIYYIHSDAPELKAAIELLRAEQRHASEPVI